MKPQEIARLAKQSEQLKRALSVQKRTLWRFLREQVEYRVDCAPLHSCERCKIRTYPTLESPYNADHPGWCIECVLHGYWHDLQRYEPPEEVGRIKVEWTHTRFCYTAGSGWQVMDEHGVWLPCDRPPWV